MSVRVLVPALAAALSAAPAAAAVSIDFNDLHPASGRTYVYGPYESQGYQLSSSTCPADSRGRTQCFVTPANTVNNIDRTGAALVNFAGSATVTLAAIDGSVFTLDSIVLASNSDNSGGYGPATQAALFTFNLADGTSVTESRTIDSTGRANRNLLTFAIGPITSFSFRPTTNTGGFLQFDDIVVSPVAAAVPEPAAWAMMIAGFGLAGAALRRRERLAAA